MSAILLATVLSTVIPSGYALYDCQHGFVGRMQASVEDAFFSVNDTRMCAAAWCIKVLIHSAFDDDHIFQQGISTRCGYTGGDRQMCSKTESEHGGCLPINYYDGMKGNFSFCCCRSPNCNAVQGEELARIYNVSKRKPRRNAAPSATITAALAVLFMMI